MWQLVNDKAGWAAYRDRVLIEMRVTSREAVSLSAEPHTFPCLADAITVAPGKILYCFVYPVDFDLFCGRQRAVPAVGTVTAEPAAPVAALSELEKSPTRQADFNTHVIAYLLTLTHIVCDTLCVTHEDFEARFAEKLALVDQELAAQRDGTSAKSPRPPDAAVDKMFDRLI